MYKGINVSFSIACQGIYASCDPQLHKFSYCTRFTFCFLIFFYSGLWFWLLLTIWRWTSCTWRAAREQLAPLSATSPPWCSPGLCLWLWPFQCLCLCLHRPGARQEGGDGGAGLVQALAQDERQDGMAVRPHVSDPPVIFFLALPVTQFYF